MLIKLREKVIQFINGSKKYVIVAALASGLYPLLYYYNANFTLVNSWSQFGFFIVCFLLIPCLVFWTANFIFNYIGVLKRYNKYVIPILNFTLFAVLLVISTQGFRKIILALAILISFVLAILFYKHLKKVIVFQFLLALIVFAKLIPDFYKHFTYSNQWMEQPDAIEEVLFVKKPNIYIIQPDGYPNFYELKRGYYNFDNSEFEAFLTKNSFKLYQNFRSNYVSTLSSNSSMFAMKHHYYNNIKSDVKELYNTRQIITGNNPVISILKKNNYKTFLMLERPYLLVNRPKINYDYCNFDFSEISFLARGFEINKDIKKVLARAINDNSFTNNFYFIGKMLPSHISVHSNESKGKVKERENYLNDIKKANQSLKEVVKIILEKDKNSLIVIVADHGGYVGLNYSLESKIKQTDRDLIYSIFTSALAIKWPEEAPVFDNKLKSNVNLFRILISYLSEDESYLDFLQPDKSFAVINVGAPFGVYEYINENGSVVFNKLTN